MGQDGLRVPVDRDVAAHRGLGHHQLDDVRDDRFRAAGGCGSVADEVLHQRTLFRHRRAESVRNR